MVPIGRHNRAIDRSNLALHEHFIHLGWHVPRPELTEAAISAAALSAAAALAITANSAAPAGIAGT